MFDNCVGIYVGYIDLFVIYFWSFIRVIGEFRRG